MIRRSRFLFVGLLCLALPATARAGRPHAETSTVLWANAPYSENCASPMICPQGDAGATISVTVHDQFNSPMVGIGASEVIAKGACVLFGTGCTQLLSIAADTPTNGSGKTTITIPKAGSCCTTLEVSARTWPLDTLTYVSPDFTGDGAVDMGDLGVLAQSFNRRLGWPGYDACCDVNCDGEVSLTDLGLFARHYDHRCN